MQSLLRTLLVILVTCTACAVPSADPAMQTTSAPSQSPLATAAATPRTGIPVGVGWHRKINSDEREKFNVSRSPAELGFAPDGTLDLILKFGEDTWTQFANYNGGAQQPGDAGTYRYDDAGNLLLTTSSDGSTSTFSWKIAEGVLTLRMLGVGPTSSGELAIARMMSEGEYRQGDS